MTMPGMQRLTEAYSSEATAAQAARRQAAGRFQPDDDMEALARLGTLDPSRISPSQRVALGYYQADKQAWQQANPGAFVVDPEMEALICKRADDPAGYFALPVDVRQQVDRYVVARAADNGDEGAA